jgi:hypothetical protein
MSRHKWAVLAALTLGLVGCAKVVVVEVPKQGTAQINGEGVFYALPRTVARVVVKADKTTSRSAPYARFARIFAPGSKPPCRTILDCKKPEADGRAVVSYELQDGAAFSTFGEPDPEHVFMVRFSGRGAIDQTLSMAWNEAGVLSSASASVTNRTTDIVVSGIKAATGLATKAAAGSASATEAPIDTSCKADHAANDAWVIKILTDFGAAAQNVLVANYCDLPPANRDPDPAKAEDSRDDFNQSDDERLLKRAMNAYLLRVAPLVDRRTNLLTGAVANILEPDKLLTRIDAAIEEQITQLFVGSVTTKTWELPFEVRNIDTAAPTTLVKFSDADGICPETSLLAPDAKAPPAGFGDPPASAKCTKSAAVTFAPHPPLSDQLATRVTGGVKDGTGERSFSYRLPVQVRARLQIDDKRLIGSGVFSVAQLGKIISLPAKRNSKSISYDLAMIEATGGLKTFKLGTTGGLDAATIDALAGAAGASIDAQNARRKEREDEAKAAEAAAATAADELIVLTRQHNILKLKDEICELQKKYGLACTIEP